ncbi:hypothetical protein [Brevibacterium antiquum]|uniref:hypothetical protein n=1 Tax=Brevibacterium antiquum TaxID=234835 RepID=UPI0011AF5013|nr:hypothetical protein [Brevibacterium antiquum]
MSVVECNGFELLGEFQAVDDRHDDGSPVVYATYSKNLADKCGAQTTVPSENVGTKTANVRLDHFYLRLWFLSLGY